MTILVSDTSVLIDLERGELIPCAFELSATFAVPDVLYERELRDHGGEELMKLGLKVESLDGDGVALAMRHMQAQRRLTISWRINPTRRPSELTPCALSLFG